MRKTMTPRMIPRARGTARRMIGRSMLMEEVGGGEEGAEERVVEVWGIDVRGVEVRRGREEEVRETGEGLEVRAGSLVVTDGETDSLEPG